MFLSHEKRREVRTLIGNLTQSHSTLEKALRKGEDIPSRLSRRLKSLTQTIEPANQLTALESIIHDVRGSYLEKLRQLAPDDLTAYAEYINPDEPPAPHHVWMCDRLMELEQKEILRMTISMPPGHAKALALTTRIPTPQGTKTIADLSIGDQIFGKADLVTVTAKSPVFTGRRTFEAKVDDGSTLVCDADHLWTVRLCRKRNVYKTYTTLELFDRQKTMKDFRRPRLPDITPAQYPEKPLDVDPYLLGLWLGNGAEANMTMSCDSRDKQEVMGHLADRGIETSNHDDPTRYGILNQRSRFVKLGLLNNKHIPIQYIENSEKNRTALVQGLMDSDGTSAQGGQCTFSNTNRNLIDGLRTVLHSLGIKNSLIEGEAVLNGKSYGTYWRVSFYFKDAFKLSRKAKNACDHQEKYTGRYIEFSEIETTPTQCITVSADDGLFLAGDGFIVTHNSTYASRIFPSWVMGRNPKNRYIQAGHTTNFCENEFGKKTKTIIESDAFRSVFPEVELAVDAKAAGYWALARFGGSYLTRGVGQGISGFRAHVAAVDDPFASREDAESQTVRNKVYDWFMADFTTRLLPYCPMFVVATRWHSDDLIGRIEDLNKKGIGLPWYIINLPAVCDDVNDAMGRELDEPLWPDFYTLDSLMTLKATLPPRDWNSLYMGKPVDEEGGVIEGAWLKRFSTIPKPSDVRRVTVSVDSASKDTQRADYTVIGVWYELMNGNHYLVHLDRDRMELPALVKRIETIATHWEASSILVEDKGSGTQYIQLRSQHAPCPVIAIAVDNNSKQFRFDGVAPMFEAGKVFIPDHGLWVPDYERELLGFPNAKYDDQVDMTSQYLTWVRKKRRLGQQKLKGQGLASTHSSEKMSPKKAKVMKEIEKNIDLIRQKHEDDPIRVALRAQAVRDLTETRKGPG